MKRKNFLALMAGCLMIFGMAGCQGDIEAEQVDTETTIQESEQTVTVTEQTSVHTEESETLSVQVESEAAETAAQKIDLSDFVYPDDPLTAENLLEITSAAKEMIGERGEAGVYNCFGLVDIDFDGFPELFHEGGSIVSYSVSFYSLAKENFCEKLLMADHKIRFGLYAEHIDVSEIITRFYMRKGKQKSIAVETYKNGFTHGIEKKLHEIKNSSGVWTIDEKFSEYWKCNTYNDRKYNHENGGFWVDGAQTDMNDYEYLYVDYYASLTPINYLYEDIIYYANPDGDTDFTYKVNENYNELYDLYDNYLKSLSEME